MSIEFYTAGTMLVSLILYTLLGGADFGAGLWDLLAHGDRRAEQRRLLADAIGPIWEANHVWLVLLIVLLFTGFPPAFAAVMTALHVPMTILLIGIVARGSSFVFRAYAPEGNRWDALLGRVFSIASVITPVLLGMCLGTLATGELQWQGDRYTAGFFRPWIGTFPFAVGLFALTIFSFLAAVYLCVEATDGPLREDFRRRAIGGGIAVGLMAAATWFLATRSAPAISNRLIGEWWAVPLQIATAGAAIGALATLFARRYFAARAFAVAQVALIVGGYGAAMHPYLIFPQFTIHNSAAPSQTHRALLIALTIGGVILFPSLYVLFRLFKGGDVFKLTERKPEMR